MYVTRKSSMSRADGSWGFHIYFRPADVKHSLQRFLRKELTNEVYSLHSEEELREVLIKDLFSFLPPKYGREAAEWAIHISLGMGYICRSSHDQESGVPMFYIPKALLNLRTGPKRDYLSDVDTGYSYVPGISAHFEEQPEEITQKKIINRKFYEKGRKSADSTGTGGE